MRIQGNGFLNWRNEGCYFSSSDLVRVSKWFSIFLILSPFNTVPHGVVTPDHKIISLLLYNCKFATVMNHNINISDMQGIGYVTGS